MVYQGPSRGCKSCRLQRKKCDETRPSCLRCTKAHRICGGYGGSALSTWQHYRAQKGGHVNQLLSLPVNASRNLLLPSSMPQDALSSFMSMGQRCTLPKRSPIPGTDILPEDGLPYETTVADVHFYALRVFFYDFCVTPTNTDLSRGFLSGLEYTVTHRLGLLSNLARACVAVSLSCDGKRLQRPFLVRLAASNYQQMLSTLAMKIMTEKTKSTNNEESRRLAMLLGLYQIVMASDVDPGYHEIHARGLAAIMNITHSPLDLLGYSPWAPGIFSSPTLGGLDNNRDDSLGILLRELHVLWTRSSNECSSEGHDQRCSGLQKECAALEKRFAAWEDGRSTALKPITVGTMDSGMTAAGFWPGPVDTYFDFFVSGAWNVFRAARLLLLSLILRWHTPVDDISEQHVCAELAIRVVYSMLASVPYHLTENLQSFLQEAKAGAKEIRTPGRTLGGLLLLHPLYVASQLPSAVPQSLRSYICVCLKWMETHMGIGQAGLFAKEGTHLDMNYVASSCMIIWAGFLG